MKRKRRHGRPRLGTTSTNEASAPARREPVHVLPIALGLIFLFLSVLVADGQERREAFAAHAVPAKVTLLSTQVRDWGRDDWSAFGTFRVVAGGHSGEAEGCLDPPGLRKYVRKGRRAKVTRAAAEAVLTTWGVGQTYDAVWNPDHPGDVLFHYDLGGAWKRARVILGLRIGSVLLVLGGIFLWRLRRAPAPAP